MQTARPASPRDRGSPRKGIRPLPGNGERPERVEWIVRLFGWYACYYLKRHFASVRIHRPPQLHAAADKPCIVYLNHPSWWDPLICLLLDRQFFGERHSFAVIEDDALARYAFFRKLGFFGVKTGTRSGAVEFLRKSQTLLQDARNTLWLTPQGRFADPRERPLALRPGLAHLLARLSTVTVFPLAIEYFFTAERLPEVGVSFGDPIQVEPGGMLHHTEWQEILEERLLEAMEGLAKETISRKIDTAPQLLAGAGGTGGIYGVWESIRKARPAGERKDSGW